MYFLTDNTMTKVERAFLICAAQPTTANYSDLYDGNKGDIGFVELQLSFNGFFINNDYVYQKAQKMLMAMRNPNNTTGSRIIVDSNNFKYKGITDIKTDGDEGFNINPTWKADGRASGNESNITSGSVDPASKYTSNDDTDYSNYASVVNSMRQEHFISVDGT